MKLIHAHVFNPMTPSLFRKPSKTEAAEFHTVTCSASDECPVFARGQCISRRIAGLSGAMRVCPFGRAECEMGPTPKARGFLDWIKERREQQEAVGTLEGAADRVVQIRDQVWLPYSHMAAALYGEAGLMKGPFFVSRAEFTPTMIARLASARPMSMFGGEIRDYQREVVPLFVSHMAEVFPDLIKESAALSPRIAAILATLTKVGRKALLITVRPNVGTFEGWTWDGTHMTATKGFPPLTPFKAQEMRILPGPRAEVKIESDAQVSPDTVFLD